MPKKVSFEEAMGRLSEIVAKLETGETPLQESMELFEEGTKLSSSCYAMLAQAEQKITEFTDKETGTKHESNI